MLYQGSKSSHFILLDFLVVEQLVEWVRCKTVSVSSPWECKTSPNHSTSCTTDQKSIDCWLITWDRRRNTHIPPHCTKYRGGESMSHPRSFYMDGASITLSWREQMVRGSSTTVEKCGADAVCICVCLGEETGDVASQLRRSVGWRLMQTADGERTPTGWGALGVWRWSGIWAPAVAQVQQL